MAGGHPGSNYKIKGGQFERILQHDDEIVKYPLNEVQEPYYKNSLLASMQKGKRVNVTIIKGNDEIKGTVGQSKNAAV